MSSSADVIPFPRRNAEDGDRLLRRSELADRWQRHTDTIAKIPRAELPVIELGPRCKRYRLSDVLAYEQKRRLTED